ncbi:MAG: hypothetical protein NC828_00945 [Candidatus Omnitrophica bacterium]|nr:hypothetical protein [Candidatus Omnitrophota bacterium]
MIHIQDAHTNYEGQRNSAYILEELINKYGLYLILVEGGSRDVSLNNYRENSPLEIRKQTAENLLKEGTIAGEEYLNIASDYPMKLQGIEDRAVYDENMKAYLRIDEGKNDAIAYTKLLSSAVGNLKVKLYNNELRELDGKRNGFKEGKVNLNDYGIYLGSIAKAKRIDLSIYQNYKNLISSIELEKIIDFTAADRERADVIDILSKSLKEDELNKLLSRSIDFKAGKLTQVQYHTYLKDSMANAKIDIDKFPNLERYIRYIILYESIDSASLFKELRLIEDRIEQTFITNEDQRRLAKISKDLGLLIELINLKLIPDDFDYYQKNEADFNIQTWVRFLNSQLIKYKFKETIPAQTNVVEKIIPSLKDFYLIARKRDSIFLDNAKKYMKAERVNIAALIAGGFHTPTLTKLFRINNISYVVVSPKVVKPTDEQLYHKILTEGWAPATQQTMTEAGE